jgi:20S proteasome alpha/beta subunit
VVAVAVGRAAVLLPPLLRPCGPLADATAYSMHGLPTAAAATAVPLSIPQHGRSDFAHPQHPPPPAPPQPQSKTHAVLATLKRAQNELSSYQRKIFKIDDHMGIAISGLTADGRGLTRYMRNECLNHRYVYEAPMPVGRLVRQVADKHQVCTQRSWKRPYGVGLLVAGHDARGPHLYNTCPSGNYWEYKAMAIGARSQVRGGVFWGGGQTGGGRSGCCPQRQWVASCAAHQPTCIHQPPLTTHPPTHPRHNHAPPPPQASKTYLEKHYESFPTASQEEMILHGLRALAASLNEGELTKANCAVSVVGAGTTLVVLEDDDIEPYIQVGRVCCVCWACAACVGVNRDGCAHVLWDWAGMASTAHVALHPSTACSPASAIQSPNHHRAAQMIKAEESGGPEPMAEAAAAEGGAAAAEGGEGGGAAPMES